MGECVAENTLLTKAASMTEMQAPESTRRSTGEPSIVALTKALFISLLGLKRKLFSGDVDRSSLCAVVVLTCKVAWLV